MGSLCLRLLALQHFDDRARTGGEGDLGESVDGLELGLQALLHDCQPHFAQSLDYRTGKRLERQVGERETWCTDTQEAITAEVARSGHSPDLMSSFGDSLTELVSLNETRVVAGLYSRVPETVILLEHPPVVTLGRRTDETGEILLRHREAEGVLGGQHDVDAFVVRGDGEGDHLGRLGLDAEDDLIIRREISADGRNRVFINNQPTTA